MVGMTDADRHDQGPLHYVRQVKAGRRWQRAECGRSVDRWCTERQAMIDADKPCPCCAAEVRAELDAEPHGMRPDQGTVG